ncbi:hypothetical protein EXIGLDRAFT_77270 [Exidia glandulosa HHB12029]|uniref:F-box domain-containing protein n=1 Tax=Exidia glandulosa HHB12029 TaxID=1314781 RepID=A0A165NX15_EXIGL|nr:hypothetical protein EXIGLDRAFT_77270 [Exidia glandulosa HHB12029]
MTSTTTTTILAAVTLTALAAVMHHRHRTQVARPTRPLTALPLDVVHSILDVLHDTPALAALGSTCTALHALCTPRLLARVELSSYQSLYALVAALESRPPLGALVKSFTESHDKPFLFLETQGPNAPPHLLTRLLALTPRLEVLKIRSPVDVDSLELHSALGMLRRLRELEFGDATRKTVDLLAYIRTARLETVRLHCWPAVMPASQRPPDDLARAISTFLARAFSTLRTLEMDAALLNKLDFCQFTRLERLLVHGRGFTGAVTNGVKVTTCTSPCAWCAPIGAAWSHHHRRTASSSRGGKFNAARPFSFVRWLASHVGAPF